MSLFRLILLSVRHFWKMNVAVAAGVAVGTAVLAGALLVGDSMQGSLRDLVLNGLGRIDEVLVADHFFREELAIHEAAAPGDNGKNVLTAPMIFYSGAIETVDPAPDPAPAPRVDQVNLIGCDAGFWQFANPPPQVPFPPLASDEVILNEPLARLLAVKEGGAVILSLPKPGGIPAESAFGRKRVSVDTARLKVVKIIPADGLGRFALRPNQRVPLNAYVPLVTMQSLLQEPGRINAIVRQAPPPGSPWHPPLADYGIHVAASPLGYIDITTERMIFPLAIENALLKPLSGLEVQPTLTYLANTIADGKLEVPYSTVTAIDFQGKPPLGPFLTENGKPAHPLGDGEIALNSWAAQRLKAHVGDTIRIKYFEPESNFGLLTEKNADLKLAAIVKLEGAAADKRLTPAVRGLTDKNTIEDWDLPFEIQRSRIKTEDDRYWTRYGATPKAFVSLATGRRLWASRFGETTALRIRPPAGQSAEEAARQLADRIDLDPVEQGFVFRPVKALALKAASGSTPFGGLFLAFSFFVIAAAVMLVMLLFRLGIEQRARHVGLLLAIGFQPRQITRLLAGEGFCVAVAGSLVGTLAGVGYAALMLFGLRTWWLPAIGTPFLTLHVSWESPAIGFASGLVMALVAIWFAVRRMGRIAPRQLMAGVTAIENRRRTFGVRQFIAAFLHGRMPLECEGLPSLSKTGGSASNDSLRISKSGGKPPHSKNALATSLLAPGFLLLLAIAPAVMLPFVKMGDDAQVGAFFGAGSLTLISFLTLVYLQLRRGATGPAVAQGRGNLPRMALRNAARNPGRSALAVGLTASACFLIAAVSVFRVDPARQANDRTSGSGGFALIGQSELPIHFDLDTPQGRKEIGFESKQEQLLAKCRFYSFRVKSGDEASCLNLYQVSQPRLLGVGEQFIDRGGFSWADAPDMPNPWVVLADTTKSDAGPVPVVLDKTTANYALNLFGGRGQRYLIHDARNRSLDLEVAGLLNDSIFQGDLLVGADALHRYDPDVVGYRYFLIETPPADATAVQQVLQRKLGDYGFTTETTADRLSTLAAVANTYLATFQSLGGLGLLLGTIGLAVVQWRNILERRGELALLRAAGFPARTLAVLVGLENVLLLLLGLGVGLLSALVAVLPHLIGRGAAVPVAMLSGIFAAVLIAGVCVSLLATRGVLRTPILAALREER
jgi:ABC-type antimicrobial peptide transport system permease subunit